MIARTVQSRPPPPRASLSECGRRRAEGRRRNPALRDTPRAPGTPRSALRTPQFRRAFTLLELLTVIAIMGIVAAISLPTLRALKPNAKVAATRQLLDAVSRARQLAISQRTDVYMVFLPLNFFSGLPGADWPVVRALADKQLTGYAYVTLRSVGDQPGVHHPRYVAGSWKTLPKGAFIPPAKLWPGFTIPGTDFGDLWVAPFPVTNTIPFPSDDQTNNVTVSLAYIKFNSMGQLDSGQAGQPELIPVAEGSVSIPRDPVTKVAVLTNVPPLVTELPPGNTTSNFSLVYIDRLTGRAQVLRRTAQ
jgi:prepilin-type N-terminal cleavage/methylation domain-containing protein